MGLLDFFAADAPKKPVIVADETAPIVTEAPAAVGTDAHLEATAAATVKPKVESTDAHDLPLTDTFWSAENRSVDAVSHPMSNSGDVTDNIHATTLPDLPSMPDAQVIPEGSEVKITRPGTPETVAPDSLMDKPVADTEVTITSGPQLIVPVGSDAPAQEASTNPLMDTGEITPLITIEPTKAEADKSEDDDELLEALKGTMKPAEPEPATELPVMDLPDNAKPALEVTDGGKKEEEKPAEEETPVAKEEKSAFEIKSEKTRVERIRDLITKLDAMKIREEEARANADKIVVEANSRLKTLELRRAKLDIMLKEELEVEQVTSKIDTELDEVVAEVEKSDHALAA